MSETNKDVGQLPADLPQPVQDVKDGHAALKTGERRIGGMKGQLTIPADFDLMAADEIRDMFEGECSTPVTPDGRKTP